MSYDGKSEALDPAGKRTRVLKRHLLEQRHKYFCWQGRQVMFLLHGEVRDTSFVILTLSVGFFKHGKMGDVGGHAEEYRSHIFQSIDFL